MKKMRPWEEKDYALSDVMLDYWADFMKTGNPNGSGRSHYGNRA